MANPLCVLRRPSSKEIHVTAEWRIECVARCGRIQAVGGSTAGTARPMTGGDSSARSADSAQKRVTLARSACMTSAEALTGTGTKVAKIGTVKERRPPIFLNTSCKCGTVCHSHRAPLQNKPRNLSVAYAAPPGDHVTHFARIHRLENVFMLERQAITPCARNVQTTFADAPHPVMRA